MDSPFNCLLFDLDDTLYPSSTGIAQGIKKNIDDFLIEKCGMSVTKASNLRVELFKTYGSTLAGLRQALGYDIDADDYHDFVHGRLSYDVIKPDSQLRSLLRSITQRKIIFTNSDRVHAVKVMKRLGIEDCFEQIISFETQNPNLSESKCVVLKPSTDAIKIALHVARVDSPRTLFLDDNVQNISAGKTLGLWTCLVGKSGEGKEADYAIEEVKNLGDVIPEIWVNKQDGGDRSRSELELDQFNISGDLIEKDVGLALTAPLCT
ncbi:hypothetical protein ES332_A07G147900v1 [Gossypium tomentosum]|uniref:Uncharacterized protein n=1 Tax=Gossypium tomentosum TaxID=34277 RepID=A0A5D2PVJ9_GOSTO|nr:hypothetical protein ES332_A07G147900v1 [Gossypium tomentosum]